MCISMFHLIFLKYDHKFSPESKRAFTFLYNLPVMLKLFSRRAAGQILQICCE